MATEPKTTRVDDACERLQIKIMEVRVLPGFQASGADEARPVFRADRHRAAGELLGVLECTGLSQQGWQPRESGQR